MSWLLDLNSLIVASGIPQSSVFLSSKAEIPTGTGPYISVISTGGTQGERTHNVVGDAYQRPSAQILSRAATYAVAEAKLKAIYNAVNAVKNQTVNGTYYIEIRPLQSEFIDLEPDSNGRARLAFNVMGYKRP